MCWNRGSRDVIGGWQSLGEVRLIHSLACPAEWPAMDVLISTSYRTLWSRVMVSLGRKLLIQTLGYLKALIRGSQKTEERVILRTRFSSQVKERGSAEPTCGLQKGNHPSSLQARDPGKVKETSRFRQQVVTNSKSLESPPSLFSGYTH